MIPPNTTGVGAPSTQSLIVGLVRAYMGLKTDQVVVFNQKWKIPPDDRLYVTVSSLGPQKSYGVTSETRLNADESALLEDVAIAGREMIGLDIYSSSQEAVSRKEEPVLALNSVAAQQLCERWAIKLARMPLTMVDASIVDGTTRINRFHLAFSVLRTRVKTSIVEAYDTSTVKQPTLAIEP